MVFRFVDFRLVVFFFLVVLRFDAGFFLAADFRFFGAGFFLLADFFAADLALAFAFLSSGLCHLPAIFRQPLGALYSPAFGPLLSRFHPVGGRPLEPGCHL